MGAKFTVESVFCEKMHKENTPVSGVCDPGRGDGGVSAVLAALLLLVPDRDHLRRGLLLPRCPGRHSLLDRSEF